MIYFNPVYAAKKFNLHALFYLYIDYLTQNKRTEVSNSTIEKKMSPSIFPNYWIQDKLVKSTKPLATPFNPSVAIDYP